MSPLNPDTLSCAETTLGQLVMLPSSSLHSQQRLLPRVCTLHMPLDVDHLY